MSTKQSIKSKEKTESTPGYHLYDDALDDWCRTDQNEPPVYLKLDGVQVELETLANGGASITIKLPRKTARSLGLI